MSDTHEAKQKTYDLVLFGATGFTGALVGEYLARRRVDGLRWALAGRDAKKLAAVRDRLAASDREARGAAVVDPALAALPLLTADSRDPLTLRALCEQARVVCTTVGPYSLYGKDLAAACAAEGCHYCDLTGEVPFMRHLIDEHHDTARRTGARIVPGCGFDSIPSDLGVFMMHQAAQERGDRLQAVRLFMGEMRGAFSGGTLATMVNLMEEAAQDRRVLRLMADPYALCPGGARGPDGRDPMGLRYDKDLGRYTGPFLMASVNSRVVRRSNLLQDCAYGRDFRYQEQSSFRAGPRGLWQGALMTAGLGAAFAVLRSPLRRVVGRFLPQPGEGPSAEARQRGFFRARIIADLASGVRIYGLVEGKADPGYGETAKMLAEAALCLAQDPARPGFEGGVLTPAAALGEHLLARLRAAGMTFSIVPALP